MIDSNTEDQAIADAPPSMSQAIAETAIQIGNYGAPLVHALDASAKAMALQEPAPTPEPFEPPSQMADALRKSAEGMFNQNRQELNASIFQATSKNPDEEAAAQKLGAATGVGSGIALRNKDELERRKAMNDARNLDLTNNNPALANKLIADPQFAAVAHDDLSWWDKYGKLAHSVMFPLTNPAWFAESVMQTSMGKAFAGGMQVPQITELQREQALSPNGILPPEREQQLQALEAQQAQTQQETGGMLNTPASMAGNIVGMGKSLAEYTTAGATIGGTAGLLGGPFAEVTIPVGTFAGATGGFSAGMAAEFSKQAMYANYRQSRLQGIPHEQALSNAHIVGIANAVFNAGAIKLIGAPIGAAISSLAAPVTESVVVPTAKAILLNYVKAYSLHEVGAFGLGAGLKASEIGAAKISGIKTTEGTMNIAEEILTSGAHTAYDFALLNALFPLLPAAAQYRVLKESEMRQAKFKAKIKSVAENNKTKKRSPEQMQNGIESVTPESEQFVYVDRDQLSNVLMQSGASANEIEQILPGVLAQLKAENPEIAINSAHYLANEVASTKIGKALEPNLRMEKGGLSPNEILQQNIDANRVRAESKAAVEQYAKMNAGFVESAQKVEDLYFNQLVAAGLDPKFARFKAMLIRDWYATNAARANMMPEQLQAQKAYEAISEQQARERQAAQSAQQAQAKPFVPKVYQETTVTPEQTASLSEPLAAAESELNDAKTSNSITERGGKQIGDSLQKLKTALARGKLGEIGAQTWKLLERLKENLGMKAAAELASKTLAALTKLGVEFYDPTGTTYTEGWVEVEVVSWLPYKEGVSKDQPFVEKVISPIVRRNGEIIQRGQVVVREGRIDHEEHLASQAKDAEIQAKMQSELDALESKLKEEGKTDEAIKQLVAERKAELEAKAREERYGKKQQQAPAQGSFEQASRVDLGLSEQAKFDEASQRPEIVTWAKEKFGDRTAPDGSSVWQNFVEWSKGAPVINRQDLEQHKFETGVSVVAEALHGTNANFNKFEKTALGSSTKAKSAMTGYWFTNNERVSGGYSQFAAMDAPAMKLQEEVDAAYETAQATDNWDLYDQKIMEQEDLMAKQSSPQGRMLGQQTYPVYLSMQNPFVIEAEGKTFQEIEGGLTKIINKAKKDGHDSVIIKNMDDAPGLANIPSDHYLIFEPTQIKSAIANVGTFGQQDPNILRQEAVPATFYSALGVEVGKSTTKSASADSWKQQIKGLIAKGVVKEKEVYWSGLNNWLDLQEGKITKEQVQAFLDAGGVKVKVVRLDQDVKKLDRSVKSGTAYAKLQLEENGMLTPKLESAFAELEQLNATNLDPDRRLTLHAIIDNVLVDVDGMTLNEYIEIENSVSDSSIPSVRYEAYQLPGGTNYREALVTLPEKARDISGYTAELISGPDDMGLGEWQVMNGDRFVGNSISSYTKENAIQTAANRENREKPTGYMSSHWDQPNVLVHLRMNDRVDADGKKVLFVEEVQSDWGQAGREKGFVGEKMSDEAKDAYKKLNVILLSKQQAAKDAMTIVDNLGFDYFNQAMAAVKNNKNWKTTFDFRGLSDKQINDISDYVDADIAMDELVKGKEYTRKNNIPTAPFVETTSGWLELGLKQILLEAVNGKYDRVAFVDGDQSVQRYRKALTEAVDEVEITRNDDGTYTYSAIKNGAPVQGEQSVSANRINEVFGKAGSKQLLEEADANPDEIHTIASGDIEIGGEGMRKFYDTIVPQALGKMLKKLGGDKIENVNMITEKPVTQEQINAAEKRKNFTEAERLTAIYERQQLGRGVSENGQQQVGEQQGFTVTPALAEQVSQGLPLFQAAEGGARKFNATFDPSTLLATIFKTGNKSKWLHELSHFFLHVTMDLASKESADSLTRQDAQILLDWFGVKDVAAWNAMTLDEQRQHHEAFAYNWEIYLHEGKAPSVGLQRVFDAFSRYLKRVYVSIRTQLNETYRNENGVDLPILNDEVKGVMDRMLANDAQISQREAIDNIKAQWETQEESGMNDGEWAALKEMEREAHDQAESDLNKASLKQVEWLTKATERLNTQAMMEFKRLRKTVSAEETAKMEKEPIRQAENFLKTGKMLDADGNEIEVAEGFKLDKSAVGAMYPTSTTGLAPAVDLTKLRGMTMDGGLASDLVAEMFGLSSGDELIRKLVDQKPFKDELQERTNARMEDEHGDLNTEEARQDAVNQALHNELRARYIAVQNRFRNKIKTPVAQLMIAVKERAQEILAKMKLKDIRPTEFSSAEAREAKTQQDAHKAMQTPEKASKTAYTRSYNEQIAAGVEEAVAVAAALEKGKAAAEKAQAKIDAHKEKYGDVMPEMVARKAGDLQELYNRLAKDAFDIKDSISRFVKYTKNVLSDDNRKRMGADASEQIEGILSRFGLVPPGKEPKMTLGQWVTAQTDKGLPPDIAPKILDQSYSIPFSEMTVEEFADLKDAVKYIEHVSKYESKAMKAARNKSFADFVPMVVKSVLEQNPRLIPFARRTARTGTEKANKAVAEFGLGQQRGGMMIRILDGDKDGGIVSGFLLHTMDTQTGVESEFVTKTTKVLDALIQPVLTEGKMGGSGELFPNLKSDAFPNGRPLNKEERLAIALNCGNESNLQRLLGGERWTMDQIVPILRTLTDADWNFVEGVWDHFETYKPMVAELERKLNGKEPDWIEPKPFEIKTADGTTRTIKGGYYPVKFDPAAGPQAKIFEDVKDVKSASYAAHGAATTRRGYVKARVEEVHDKPLLLNMNGMYSGFAEVIHDLAWREWLIDANRFMANKEIDKAIREKYGAPFVDGIRDWIKRIAGGTNSDNVGGVFNFFRHKAVASTMAWKVATLWKHAFDISKTASILGADKGPIEGWKYVFNAAGDVFSNYNEAIKEAFANSPELRHRFNTRFRELNEIKNAVAGQSKFDKFMYTHGLILHHMLWKVTDVWTWKAAAKKYIANGFTNEEAYAMANRALIDSQGSGTVGNLSAVEGTRSPALKLFTALSHYMINTSNILYVKTKTRTPGAAGTAKLVANYLQAVTVPVIYEELMRHAIIGLLPNKKKKKEKETAGSIIKEFSMAHADYLLGSVPIAREMSSGIKEMFGVKTAGYQGPFGLKIIPDTILFARQMNQKEFDAEFRRAAIRLLGDGTGLPASQLNSTIDGIEALFKGETMNPLAPILGTRH